jgi:diacylglycerol O-acyltransferase / wax synthase
VISNVPGPRRPLFLAGAKLEAHYPVSVVVDGVGLNITVMSYLDHLDFGIVADRDQVDDTWALMDRLAHSLQELTQAVLGKAGKRRAKHAAAEKPKVRA